MPGPSKYNRKLKARNDAKKKGASRGGRTASERGLGRSMVASGRAVSKSNLRPPRVPKTASRPRVRRSPLATPRVQSTIERLRTKAGASGRTLSQENLADNLEVSRTQAERERKLENTALRSLFPTRGEALKAEDKVRAATRLNAEGTRVELLAGMKQVGNERRGAVQEAADRGQLRREGKRFTTPRVRRTQKQVKRARRQLRKARAATRTPVKNLMAAGLDAEQAQVLTTVLNTGRKMGATKKEMLSAVETALVESNIRNLDYGDRDSLGWRQERQMYYPNPTNVKDSSRRYFEETAAEGRGVGMTAGQLAQAAQQSAFPEKYDERKGDAVPLLRAFRSAGNASPKAKARLEKARARFEKANDRAEKLGLYPKPGKDKSSRAGDGGPKVKDLSVDGSPGTSKTKWFTPDENTVLKFQSPLANALLRLAKASGEPIRFQSGYRSSAEQAQLYQAYLNGTGNLAAPPGSSNHEFGAAADVTLTARQRELAPQFGLGFPVPGEDWHIELVGDAANQISQSALGGGGGGAVPSGGGGGGGGGTLVAGAGGGGNRRTQRQSALALLRQLGYQVTPSGIKRTGLAASGPEPLRSATEIKKKYGVK